MTDQVTAVDTEARREIAALSEVVARLHATLAALEAVLVPAPDSDPVAEAFLNYRDKARAVTARQREEV
jgi:hypothetical protein